MRKDPTQIWGELEGFAKALPVDSIYKAQKPSYVFQSFSLPFGRTAPFRVTLHHHTFSAEECFYGILELDDMNLMASGDPFQVCKIDFRDPGGLEFLNSEKQTCDSCQNKYFYAGRSTLAEEDGNFGYCEIYVGQCSVSSCGQNKFFFVADIR